MGIRIVLGLLVFGACLLGGCSSDRTYCDSDGCYSCDGIGCRTMDPPDRTSCRGDFECADGLLCTDLGCVDSCDGADCPDGTECRQDGDEPGLCLSPTEPDPDRVPGVCQRDADCGDPALVCVEDRCAFDAPECTRNRDCEGDQVCDDGVCVDDTGCVRNADCGDPSLVCRDAQCVIDDRSCGELGCSCLDSGACSEGYVCTAGECRAEEDTCRFNHECGADRVCIDARCVSGCATDEDCVEGQLCEDQLCRPAPLETGECTMSVDCGEGRVCVDTTCFDGCTRRADCGDGRYCDAGICRVDDRPDPFCSSDSDCQPGHPCISGTCRTPCETSEQCLRFDVQFNYCLEGFCATTNEATSNCASSAECDATQDCLDGICR